MYKNILVPHGGTKAGDEAVRHAIYLAKSDSAKLTILHIVETILTPGTFGLSSSERESLLREIKEANLMIKKGIQVKLNAVIDDCKKNGIDAKQVIVEGDPAHVIIQYIKNNKIDLVVMAKRRKLKGIKKLLSLGSVSRKVVEHSSCPVHLIDIENK